MAPPVDSATHCELDDTAENCGIEVTPEMIEAGRSVISACWLDFIGPTGDQLWAPVLRGVFLAMTEARYK